MASYGSLIAEFVFGFLLLLLLARFFLSGNSASNGRTLPEFGIKRLTDWLVLPLYWVPRWRSYESPALLAALLTCIFLDILTLSLQGVQLFQQPHISLPLIFARSMLFLMLRITQLYMVIVIIGVIVSWFNLNDPNIRLTVVELFNRFLRPFRKYLPTFGGIDLSPLAAVLALQVAMLALRDTLAAITGIFT